MGPITVMLSKPYLVFVGEETNPVYAKTGAGLVQWDRENCVGQLRLTEDAVDLGVPECSVEEALKQGAKTLVLGIAVVGGRIPTAMMSVIEDALSRGLDVASGMHDRLGDMPTVRDLAQRSGAKLIDVRVPPADIPIARGVKREGKRLLTVGTDCALGKKYTALALAAAMRDRGMDATFRATGQTGILIAGSGIPIDAVVSDFVAGAAETLSPDAAEHHWDIVEGQGGIVHPAYAAVSMGLLMGSQPDAFVVCTDATRSHIVGWPDFPLPSIQRVMDITISLGQTVNPNIRCVGISANTSGLPADERASYRQKLSDDYGLPCVDPLDGGVEALVDFLAGEFPHEA